MKIAAALKKKNRIIKRINDLKRDINTFNSVIKGSETVDIHAMLKELNDLKSELFTLKTNISKANMSLGTKIYELNEVKDTIAFLRRIPIESGPVKNYSSGVIEMECRLSHWDIQTLLVQYEELAEKLQEEIDSFNHTTDI